MPTPTLTSASDAPSPRPTRSRRLLLVLLPVSLVAQLLAGVPAVAAQEPAPAPAPIECGYGLVCGTGPIVGDGTRLAVTGADPWRWVVQGPAATAWASLEAEATSAVAALHGVPNDTRVALWARDEIRAYMFSRLNVAVNKAATTRTADEQAWVDELAARVQAERVASAQSAIDQYDLWQSSPCQYAFPEGSAVDPYQNSVCAQAGGGLGGLVVGADDFPPTFDELQAAGKAVRAQAIFGDPSATRAWNEAATMVVFFSAIAAAAALTAIGVAAAIAVPGAALAIATAMGSALAGYTIFTTGATVAGFTSAWAAAAGVTVAIGAIASVVTIVVVAAVVIGVRIWQFAETLSLREELVQAKTDAQAAPPDVAALVATQEGQVELWSVFLAQTLPAYDAERAAASTPFAHRPVDPDFLVTTADLAAVGTVGTLSLKGGGSVYLSDGWFVHTDGTVDPEWALTFDFTGWDGLPRTASIHGQQFMISPPYTGQAEPPPAVLSPHIDYQDTEGNNRRATWTGNRPPVIAPTISSTVSEGSPVTLSAGASDPDGDDLTYSWFIEPSYLSSTIGSLDACYQSPWGDGTLASPCPWQRESSPTVVKTYLNDGLRRVRLIVADEHGATASQVFVVDVQDVAPSLVVDDPPAAATPGETVTLSGSVTDPGDDTTRLTVDWGDGTVESVFVTQCGLVASLSSCPRIPQGELRAGAPATTPFEFEHAYASDPIGPDNDYDITVTAADGAATDVETRSVTVTDDAPTLFVNVADAGPLLPPGDRRTTTEGGVPIQVRGHVGTTQPFRIEITWGDGSVTGAQYPCPAGAPCDFDPPPFPTLFTCGPDCVGPYFAFEHRYADGPVTHPISVVVTDDDGRTVTAGASASVGNVAPTAILNSDLPCLEGELCTSDRRDVAWGEPVRVRGRITDPGLLDAVGATIDWGDGTTTECPSEDCTTSETEAWAFACTGGCLPSSTFFDASHTYDRPGEYDIDIDVFDSDGEGTALTTDASVSNTPPVATDLAVTMYEDGEREIDLSGLVTDAEFPADVARFGYVVDAPTHGTIDQDGAVVTYRPDPDFAGDDSFTFEVCDLYLCDRAEVAITVAGINDAPTVSSVTPARPTAQYSDPIAPVTIVAADVDDEAADLTLHATGLPAGLALVDAGDGTATITGVVTADAGTYPVSVWACDPLEYCSEPTVVVLEVDPEDAIVQLTKYPKSVSATSAGAPSITISASIADAPDGSPGDLLRARAATLRLVPTGGGTGGECLAGLAGYVAPKKGKPGAIVVECTVPAGLAPGTYDVVAELDGVAYRGSAAGQLVIGTKTAGGKPPKVR